MHYIALDPPSVFGLAIDMTTAELTSYGGLAAFGHNVRDKERRW